MWVLWWPKWYWDRFFSRVLRFSPVSIIPPWLAMWRMNKRPVSGRSSETRFLPTNMNSMNVRQSQLISEPRRLSAEIRRTLWDSPGRDRPLVRCLAAPWSLSRPSDTACVLLAYSARLSANRSADFTQIKVPCVIVIADMFRCFNATRDVSAVLTAFAAVLNERQVKSLRLTWMVECSLQKYTVSHLT
jgi:hypothetical protein